MTIRCVVVGDRRGWRMLVEEQRRIVAEEPLRWRWIYCGTDAVLYARLKTLKWPCTHQPIGALIQRSAQLLRTPFIERLGALDAQPPIDAEIFPGFPFWWLTPVS